MGSAAPPPPSTGDACGCAAALDRAAILAEAADDPALASCCARDLADQAKGERVRAALLAADRVEARVRAAVVGRSVAHAPPPPGDDADDDVELAALRASRLAQLRAAAEATAEAAVAGGELTDLASGRALRRLVAGQSERHGRGGGGDADDDGDGDGAATAGLGPAAPPVVAHLHVPGAPGGAALDEALAALAAGAAGRRRARFVRVPVSAAASLLPPHARPPPGVGVLAAFRGGVLAAAVPLPFLVHEAGGGPDDGPGEEGVARWLRRAAGVAGVGEGDGSGSDDEAEDVEPCAECGRAYPHEHIRATRMGGGGGGGWGGASSSSGDER